MKTDKRIIKAEFVKRPNRFQAYVKINGEEQIVHVPNTGRCREILLPGSIVLLREESNPTRKTKYDLIAGYKGNRLINIDSQVPNKVVEEALKNKKIESLQKYSNIQREKFFQNSRFDFKLSDDNGDVYYLEVKGVTLEHEGITKFPDAPTERGKKHLLELIEAKKKGYGAGVLFLIQMRDVESFSPNEEMDKLFSEALKLAYKNGVDIYAYDCEVGENFITLRKPVTIKI